ncbi:uncharacterized protein [Lepeophtheirus salmonis]|uniref:uncharacterized protein isoform X1 n=1 Tax=Lepeophtheirus salmonis TaxID=72036 RepID=UPI001AE51C0E|nr:uncharacterized protein LOC121118882 isoform X1 [Lepeophtheirus salmonis]XP_040569407.1 uncharacterized protein LOC121118882 isoform X1 [Lepeophtheirus salmonis]
MSGRRRSTFQETEEEESLWENLEDIENIFEKELKDLKEISTSRGHNTNVEHENGSHFEEQESLIWNCGLCGSYYFKDHLHFSNHLLEHHSVEERKRQNQNFYGCLSCGNGFKDLDILESHLLVEELCHKDYDKALLALYKRHSVPRFFAPLYDRCKTCQDKFDKLYRLLQYFPRCGHSENNRPRKISSQSALTKSNSNGNSNQESSTNVICGRDKKNRKSFSNNSTKIMDSSQNENNLQSHMGSSDDSFLLDNDDDYFNGYFFIGTLSMNKSKISIDKYNYRRSEQEVDPLICMGKVKTKSTRTKKNNSNIFHGFQPTNTINDSNLVCHGFNGVKWIHSRSSNQIKNRIKGKKSSKRIKLNPALNLDGAYDEDSSSPTHGVIEIIEIDADDNGCHEDIQGVEGIIESFPCKQDSLSQPCIECKIDGFESRRAFLFHQVFLHERSYCPHCDLIFETSVDLFNHEKEVHTFFPCDNCKKQFSTYDGLIIHLRKHHDTYLCPFCNLIFSKDTIEGHFSNNHRLQVNQYTLNEWIKIALSGIKIISNMNSLTATCSFCLKMKSLHKIYDHYRVWHNFTSLHLFKILAQSGFTLEPNSCNNNVQYHSSEFQNVGYSLDFNGKCSSQKYPLDSYDCPVKNCANKKRNDKDYGLHLLIHHNLKYCLACDTFFKIISDLNTYSHTNCAGNSFECSLCHSNFNDVFSLFQHRVQIHGLLTCILCKNLIFTHKESFYVHFRHSHNVHKSWYINLDISKQFDRSLVSISESKSRIKCNLCEKVELKLDQTGALRSHLSSIHGVEAYNILFASYDGFKDFKVSSISQKKNDNSSYESIQFEDTSECIFITENDVNVIIEKTGNGQIMNELNDIPQKLPKSILEKDKSSYICSVCDEGFKSSLKLQSHVDEIHSQSGKNYRCDFCPTMTNSLESMKKHLLKIHKSSILMSEEYSLKCNYCSENFWSLGERHAHMNKKHPDSKIDGDFKCKICKHVSPNKNALRRHFQRMHPAEPLRSNVSYKCDICQILFQWKSQLHDHVKEKHKDQEENGCNVCKLKFKSVKALKNHEKKLFINFSKRS